MAPHTKIQDCAYKKILRQVLTLTSKFPQCQGRGLCKISFNSCFENCMS